MDGGIGLIRDGTTSGRRLTDKAFPERGRRSPRMELRTRVWIDTDTSSTSSLRCTSLDVSATGMNVSLASGLGLGVPIGERVLVKIDLSPLDAPVSCFASVVRCSRPWEPPETGLLFLGLAPDLERRLLRAIRRRGQPARGH
jgi:c-di-GMP-binding flagellar brake protein YcgR